jgi:hypothetical protein
MLAPIHQVHQDEDSDNRYTLREVDGGLDGLGSHKL